MQSTIKTDNEQQLNQVNSPSLSISDRILLYSELVCRQAEKEKKPSYQGWFSYEIAQQLGIENNKTKASDLINKWIKRVIRPIYASFSDHEFNALMRVGDGRKLSQIAFDEIDMLSKKLKPQYAMRKYCDRGFLIEVIRHNSGLFEGQPVYIENKDCFSKERYIEYRHQMDNMLLNPDLRYQESPNLRLVSSEPTRINKAISLEIVENVPEIEQEENKISVTNLTIFQPGSINVENQTRFSFLNTDLAVELISESDESNLAVTQQVEELQKSWLDLSTAYQTKCKALGKAIASQGQQIILNEIVKGEIDIQKKIINSLPT